MTGGRADSRARDGAPLRRSAATIALALAACLAPLLAWGLQARLPRADRVLWQTLSAELCFVGLALLIARARGGSLRERLGLVRGELAAPSALASIAGVLALSGALAFAVAQLGRDPDGSLGRLDAAAFEAAAESPWLLLIAFGVAPGVCEELLFRGALQRSFERRLRGFSVGVSALAFALVHLDPVHALAALPLGVYLGAIARRGRTTWLAILCHVANNCAALLPPLQRQLALVLPRPASWQEAAQWLAASGLALALFFWATRSRGVERAPSG